MFGSIQVAIHDGDEAPALPAGIRIGMQRDRPMALRLFRPRGTRVAVLAGAVPAQLLAMRAAAAGATIRVQSPRPQAWRPVLRHGATVSIAPPGAALPPPGTLDAPVLVVDGRPADLGAVTHADVLVLGQVGAAIADALAATISLSMSLIGQLAALGPGSVALVARGTIRYVSLDPSEGEAQLLAQGAR